MNDVVSNIGVGNLLMIGFAWTMALFSLRSLRPEGRAMLLEGAGRPTRLALSLAIGLADGLFRWVPRLPELPERVRVCERCRDDAVHETGIRLQETIDATEQALRDSCPHPHEQVAQDSPPWCERCDSVVELAPPRFSSIEEAEAWLERPTYRTVEQYQGEPF